MSHKGFVTLSQSKVKFGDYVGVKNNQVFPFIGNGLRRFAKLLKRQSFALTCLFYKTKVTEVIIYFINDYVFAKGNLNGQSTNPAKRGYNFTSVNVDGSFPKDPQWNLSVINSVSKLSGKESLALAPDSPHLPLIL